MDSNYSPPVPGDFDFARGRVFQAEVLRRFRSSVHHPSSSIDSSFFMLAVFRRFTFRLTEESVSLALHSVLGGTPAGFHVHAESDRHFRFSVASKAVGLHIRSVERFTTKNFDLYCFLWRDGTPNWKKDEIVWNKEQEKEWTTVSYKRKPKQFKNRVSFAKNLIQQSPPIKFKPSPAQVESVKPAICPAVRSIQIGEFLCPLPQKKNQFFDRNFVVPHQNLISAPRVFNKLHASFENFQISTREGQRVATTHWSSASSIDRQVKDASKLSKPQHWWNVQGKDNVPAERAHGSPPLNTPIASSPLPNLPILGDELLCSEQHLMSSEQCALGDRPNPSRKDLSLDLGQTQGPPRMRSNEERLCFRAESDAGSVMVMTIFNVTV
ncbi:hypothetical protein EJB05_00111, partial [Eragrostis curvula]